MNNIVLFGFKNVGKTQFGKYLSNKLNRIFIDTDHLIEKECCMSPRDISLQWGERYFREVEKKVIQSLAVKNAVIALGGGAVIDQENVAFLQERAILIYLEGDKEVLRQKALAGPLPSFIPHESAFDAVYQSRIKIYERINAIKIKVTEDSAWEAIALDKFLESQLGENPMEKQLAL